MHPERVQFFEIEPLPISSEEIRDLVARGASIDRLVPPAVAEVIETRGLYRTAVEQRYRFYSFGDAMLVL